MQHPFNTLLTGLIVSALALSASAALTTTAQGATPSTTYDEVAVDAPDGQATGRWAERLATAGDINNDGVADYFVAAPSHTLGGLNNAGRVYLMNGRTHDVLYRIDSPEPEADAQFGFYIAAFGDVDGDGETDIAIGTDAQNVGPNTRQGRAWVFSGADGGLLHTLDNPDPQSDGRFGSRIGSAGDVTADGVTDVLVGASNNDIPAGCAVGTTAATIPVGCYRNIGQAYIFSGATGALVRTLDVPATDRAFLGLSCFTGCGSFGIAVQSPGDTNANGVGDQLVGASSMTTAAGSAVGRMYLFEGATGTLRLRIDPPDPQPGTNWSFQDAAPGSPGDVTGDGRADLYANGFTHSGPAGPGQGRAWIFSGANGALVRALDDPVPTEGGQFGWSVAVTDYNKDGVPDQYVGQSPHHVADAPDNGGTYVLDGRNGALLRAFELPAVDAAQGSTTPAGPRLGWTVAAPGDLNGDGEPDYLGGAPFTDVGANVDQGRLWAFMSRPAAAAACAGPAARIGRGQGHRQARAGARADHSPRPRPRRAGADHEPGLGPGERRAACGGTPLSLHGGGELARRPHSIPSPDPEGAGRSGDRDRDDHLSRRRRHASADRPSAGRVAARRAGPRPSDDQRRPPAGLGHDLQPRPRGRARAA